MTDKEKDKIEEEITKAPANLALRLNFALKLFKDGDFDRSELHYREALKIDPDNIKAKQGMSEIFFQRENYSAVIVIAEELSNKKLANEKILELLAKSYLRFNQINDAQEIYKKLLDNNLFYFDEELDSVLEDEFEYVDTEPDMEPSDDFDGEFSAASLEVEINLLKEELFIDYGAISKDDVFGLDRQFNELAYKMPEVLEELNYPQKIMPYHGPKRALLVGPPGVGKTCMVNVLPINYRMTILPFQLSFPFAPPTSDIITYLNLYVQLADDHGDCVLYFDNVEMLARRRDGSKDDKITAEFLKLVNGAFPKLSEIFLLASTNKPWELDPALLQRGRFESSILLTPPDQKAREDFLSLAFDDSDISASVSKIAKLTEHFTISEIEMALEYAMMVHYAQGPTTKPIPEDVIVQQVKMMSPITPSWCREMLDRGSETLSHTHLYKQIELYAKKNGFVD